MIEAQKDLNDNLKEVVRDLETKSIESIEREKITQEISELRQKVKKLKETDSSANEIEIINKQIESLIKRIQKL